MTFTFTAAPYKTRGSSEHKERTATLTGCGPPSFTSLKSLKTNNQNER